MDVRQSVQSVPAQEAQLVRGRGSVPPPIPAAARGRAQPLLGNRYRLGAVVERLSAGSELLVADDLLSGRACTVRRAEVGHEGSARVRFLREAGIAARLGHPNIAAVWECSKEDEATPFLIMEPLNGRSLQRLLTDAARLSLQRTLEILGPAALALQHAHDLDIVHGNLQPGSCFLHIDRGSEEGRATREVIKLLDFGLSYDLRTRGTGGAPTDQTPESLAHRPPETLPRSGVAVDARADQWSLGVLAFRMLSGRLPFPQPDPKQRAAHVRGGIAQQLEQIVPELPAYAARAIERALSTDKAARHASVLDFVRALDGLPPLVRGSQGEKTVAGHRSDLVALCGREPTPAGDAVPVAVDEQPTTRPYPSDFVVNELLPPPLPELDSIGPLPVTDRGRWNWLIGVALLLAIAGAALFLVGVYQALARRSLHASQVQAQSETVSAPDPEVPAPRPPPVEVPTVDPAPSEKTPIEPAPLEKPPIESAPIEKPPIESAPAVAPLSGEKPAQEHSPVVAPVRTRVAPPRPVFPSVRLRTPVPVAPTPVIPVETTPVPPADPPADPPAPKRIEIVD